MAFRYTQVTRNILNFIDEYGFITINIAASIFYKGNSNPVHQARVKLSTLYKNGALTRYKNEFGEYIYQIYKKSIGDHNYYIMKLYGYLFANFEIVYFKPEQVWLGGKRRSDAHIIIHNGKKRVGLLVEFEKFHATSQDKLDEMFNSGEIQRWYKDNYDVDNYYPTTLFVTASGSNKICDLETEYKTISTNYKFIDLADQLK